MHNYQLKSTIEYLEATKEELLKTLSKVIDDLRTCRELEAIDKGKQDALRK